MSTTYPTSKQSFTNPTSTSTLDNPSHADQHADINDTVEAIQDRVGTGSDTTPGAAENILIATSSTAADWSDPRASASDVNTGTSATKYVTPDALAGSVMGEKSVCIVSFDSATSVATGNGAVPFTVPASMAGMNLVNVVCSVHTKGITGTTDVQVRARTGGVDSDMLTTKVTIGDEFFATDETVDTANDDVTTGDQIFIDVDAVHSGTAPLGLSTTLTFRLP